MKKWVLWNADAAKIVERVRGSWHSACERADQIEGEGHIVVLPA